jgi:ribonucleoside-triphosphate reductase
MISSVIKRNGKIVDFDKSRIEEAIFKANKDVQGRQKASVKLAKEIAKEIEEIDKNKLSVEEIQDAVEKKLMEADKYDLAKAYILYREKRAMVRQSNTTDLSIKELIDGTSDYWNNENSNKNAKIVTTQRDYLAGITSTDITRRFLLPEDVVKAHDEGIIHFHDADYFAQKTLNNCCLINLNDMLQNGTVINGVMIEKPHRFITAMTIATQIILGVSSSQYGGCTVTMSHLAPFVRDSYNKFLTKYLSWDLSEDKAKEYALRDTKKEVADGVQTFNYQVNSMTNTNGQAPFLSVCLYLGETEEYKDELAMIIEEFLNQRIQGFKNEKGVYITPAFPKLLYVLEEDNITEDGKYWYLTELAAKCTAKRMVPDYISEKIMKQNKVNQYGDGDTFPCMRLQKFLNALAYRRESF